MKAEIKILTILILKDHSQAHNKIKTFIGKNNLLDAIFLILINHPKLALDYSEELVKIDFNNKTKNKILLILLDMIITNQDLDKIEFINYLKEKDLIRSINNLVRKSNN